MKQDFYNELSDCQNKIEKALCEYFNGNMPQKKLYEAMRYSLLAGGKRIRPILVLKFCEISGGDVEKAMPFACAVEMLHTYSLIHDDLPCMDNDDLRRGKPTNHKLFGECIATLAGDALQAAAFQTILQADLSAEVRSNVALTLANAVNQDGMCGGQLLDKEGESRKLSLDEIAYMNSLKTGCLLRAACVMGVLASGERLDSEKAKAAADYADAIGLAFQIKDDILNVTSDADTMGKPVGNDAESGKSTYVSLLGLERCQEIVKQKSNEAKCYLTKSFENTDFLEDLTDYLTYRDR